MTLPWKHVVVIGLDGATFDLIRPWAQRGKLPTIGRLMDEGTWVPLRSTIHPLTAIAWSSFITGVNAGKHGIFDFTRRRPGSYDMELMSAAARQSPSLWQMLNQAGRTVGVINVPMTYPPEAVNGYIVSGLDTPDMNSRYTYPPQLASEIADRHLIVVSTVGKDVDTYLSESLEAVDRRFEIMTRLFHEQPSDFFMKVIMETDAIQHCAWHLLDGERESPVLQVYRRIDKRLGEFLATLPDDTLLLIMSDHGAGPIRKVVYLDRWLAEQGWLAFREEGHPGLATQLQATGRAALLRSIHLAQRYLPYRAKGFLKRFNKVRGQVDSYLQYSQIDWERTRAWAGGNQGNIFINVAGREPHGTVQPGAEYERLCNEIIAALHELRDPDTGEPVVERVYRREELYHGPNTQLAPDLLVRWCEDEYVFKKGYEEGPGEVFGDSLRFGNFSSAHQMLQTGTHKLHGVLIATGAGVKRGHRLEQATLLDLAPTILYALDCPIPAHLDGRPLLDLFEAGITGHHPPRHTDSQDHPPANGGPGPYDDEDQAAIRGRLQGLGYIA